jgi:hypothetical protein
MFLSGWKRTRLPQLLPLRDRRGGKEDDTCRGFRPRWRRAPVVAVVLETLATN